MKPQSPSNKFLFFPQYKRSLPQRFVLCGRLLFSCRGVFLPFS